MSSPHLQGSGSLSRVLRFLLRPVAKAIVWWINLWDRLLWGDLVKPWDPFNEAKEDEDDG